MSKVRRVSKRWDMRRYDALALAESIASQAGVGFPVNLQKLAAQCRVEAIRFRPLIVDGALGITPGGFEIMIRCKSFEATELNDLLDAAPDGSQLPARIIHKARFTIAHELAHTLFYDLKALPPKRKFPVRTHREAKALEQACNKTAAALLLPKEAIRRYFGTSDFRDPKTIATIAAIGLVAQSVTITRIPDIDSTLQPRAILATVRREGNRLEIENLWRHYSFLSRFPKLKRKVPLDVALDDPIALLDLRIFGGYLCETSFDVQIGRQIETWTLSVEPGATRSTRKTFVVSLFRGQDFP